MSVTNPMIEMTAAEPGLGTMLENRSRELPDHTALIFRDLSWTYGELNRTVDQLATGLLNMGVTPRDRIAMILPTRPEFLFTWFSAAKIGCSVIALNVRYKADEVVYMVNEARPRFMFCINSFGGKDYGQFCRSIKDTMPSVETFIFLGETDFTNAVEFDGLVTTPADMEQVSAMHDKVDPAVDHFIIFTSGSTGKPKGAVLTQKSIMAMLRPWVKNMELAHNDRLLDVLPLNHVGGGTILAMGTLASGATLVLHDVFDPASVLDLFSQQQITCFGGVPTVYELFFSLPDFDSAQLAGVQLMIYGGSAATPELLQAMVEKTSAVIMPCYGSTEVSGFCTYTSRQDPVEKVLQNTVGRAPEGIELTIRDPVSRKPLSTGDIGEVAVHGDLLIDRYLNAPELTAASFDPDGWFFTGDMGLLDAEGYLKLVGRYKEMYICGGYNVYPKEVEDIIATHPAVAMCAVVGVPHPKMGEAGWAYIMKKPGTEVDPDAIRALCADCLADYKVPTRVLVRDALPMTTIGKIHKPTLREEATTELA